MLKKAVAKEISKLLSLLLVLSLLSGSGGFAWAEDESEGAYAGKSVELQFDSEEAEDTKEETDGLDKEEPPVSDNTDEEESEKTSDIITGQDEELQDVLTVPTIMMFSDGLDGPVTDSSELKTAFDAAVAAGTGTIVLADDIELMEQLSITAKENMDISFVSSEPGVVRQITLNSGNRHIDVEGTGNVTLRFTDILMVPGKTEGGIHIAANSDVAIIGSNFTIEGGSCDYGGAFRVEQAKSFAVSGVITEGGTAAVGGGAISLENVTNGAVLSHMSISGAAANYGGGIYVQGPNSEVTISDSSINGNKAGVVGGGIYSKANLEIIDSEINGNTAQNFGGGIYADCTAVEISGSQINENEVTRESSGGLYVGSGSEKIKVSDTDFKNNAAKKRGGAIGFGKTNNSAWDVLELDGVTFEGNTAGYYISEISTADRATHDLRVTGSTYSTYGSGSASISFDHAFNGCDITNRNPEVRVTYNLNGGIIGGQSTYTDIKSYGAGTTVELPADDPEKANSVFEGWSLTADGSSMISGSIDVTSSTSSFTVYAIWRSTHHTLKFDVNGIRDVYDPQLNFTNHTISNIKEGDPIASYWPTETPTQMGYEFAGWYTENGGRTDNLLHYGEEESDANHAAWGQRWDSTMEMPEEDLTLYARWKAVSFKVTTEDEIQIALSSHRKEINIDLLKDIELHESMKITNPAGGKITITMSNAKGDSDTHAKLTMAATEDTRHMYVKQSDITLNLDRIYAGSEHGYGGVEITGGSLTINGSPQNTSCPSVIGGITKYPYGGAIYMDLSSEAGEKPTSYFNGLIIENNQVTQYGGGIYVINGSAEFNNVNLENNQAGVSGGGIAVRGNSKVVLSDMNIKYNKAAHYGGGLFVSCASLESSEIKNVSFGGNGAMYLVADPGEEQGEVLNDLIRAGRYVNVISDRYATSENLEGKAYNNYDIGYTEDVYTLTYHMNSIGDASYDDTDKIVVDGVYGKNSKAVITMDQPTDVPGRNVTGSYYDFKGWSRNRQGTDIIEDPEIDIEEEDVMLYAAWKRQEITVTLDPGDGESLAEDLSFKVYRGDDIPEPNAEYYVKHDGKYFQHWADAETGTAYIFPVATDGDTADAITLEAIWDAIPADKVAIVFDTNGGTGIGSILVDPGTSVTLVNLSGYHAPVKTGYTFRGWHLGSKPSREIDESATLVVDEWSGGGNVIKLRADWKQDEYSITTTSSDYGTIEVYKLDESSTYVKLSDGETVTCDDLVRVVFLPDEKAGYELKGYEVGGTAEELFDGKLYLSNIASHITLSADYGLRSYDLTIYDWESHDETGDDASVYRYKNRIAHGSTISLTSILPAMADTGYESEWYLQRADGTWEKLADGELKSTHTTEDVTVRRQQKPVEYDITIDPIHGDEKSFKAAYGTYLDVPETPTYKYEDFQYWYADGNDSVPYTFNEPVRSDMTLKAKWSKKPAPGLLVTTKLGNDNGTDFERELYDNVTISVDTITNEYGTSFQTNNDKLKYQWYQVVNEELQIIQGATSYTISVDLETGGTVSYAVKVTYEDDDYLGDSEGEARVYITVGAKPPTVTGPDDAIVKKNDSLILSVNARSQYEGESELTYQWYQAEAAGRTTGAVISGATDKEYIVPTGAAGTYYYYVVVTDHYNELISYTVSDMAAVVVEEDSGGNRGSGNNKSTGSRDDGSGDAGDDPEPDIKDGGRFIDVSEDDWYYEAVETVAQEGLFAGTTATTFSPSDPMTRAMFVTVLGRLAEGEGQIIAAAEEKPFDDVELGTWYTDYVKWADDRDIAIGFSETRFAPEELVTREQMGRILHQFFRCYQMELPQTESIQFSDAAQIKYWAADGVKFAASTGLLAGYPDGSFRPQNTVTRAEAAQIFFNYLASQQPADSL